jgi:acyl-CoA thioester hydrolase
LRIDWSEMDLFGHVNNVSYFKYIQASRVNYWETIGLVNIFEEQKIGPILFSTSCQFLKPLHYPGNITLQARIEFIRHTSFGIHHEVLNEQSEVVAVAHDVIVMYDFNKNEKVSFPDEYRQRVATLEGRML